MSIFSLIIEDMQERLDRVADNNRRDGESNNDCIQRLDEQGRFEIELDKVAQQTSFAWR